MSNVKKVYVACATLIKEQQLIWTSKESNRDQSLILILNKKKLQPKIPARLNNVGSLSVFSTNNCFS